MQIDYAVFDFHGESLAHPQSGAGREGFTLVHALRIAQPDQAYFWATHHDAELDLLMFKNGPRVGVEFKRAAAPASPSACALPCKT